MLPPIRDIGPVYFNVSARNSIADARAEHVTCFAYELLRRPIEEELGRAGGG